MKPPPPPPIFGLAMPCESKEYIIIRSIKQREERRYKLEAVMLLKSIIIQPHFHRHFVHVNPENTRN